ncbi:MAG: CopG family transcriptional regulator [Lachnospiraceae bacterium]|nr:CopG family transcriptional regulator [Lachnospiraceae bacterium]
MARQQSEKLVIEQKRYRGTTSVVSARLPGDLIRCIDEIVANTGYNRNEVIQICLEYAMDHMETRK